MPRALSSPPASPSPARTSLRQSNCPPPASPARNNRADAPAAADASFGTRDAALPASRPAMAAGEEEELSRYVAAFAELTRQNQALRERLADAEARLCERAKSAAAAAAAAAAASSRPACLTSSAGSGPARRGRRFWSKGEHLRFLDALRRCGTFDAHDVARLVGTRTVKQVRSHAQKHFLRLARAPPRPTPDSDEGGPASGG